MTSSPFILFVALAGIAVASAKDFENLNFDEGTLSPGPINDGPQPIGTYLPGWTAHMGPQELTEVYFGYQSSAYGRVAVSPQERRPFTFEGRYGLLLQGGPEFLSSSPAVPASISQVGLIPAGTKSLLFRSDIASPTEVRINGKAISLYAVEKVSFTTIYGVDVSDFAGQEVDLSFVNYANPAEPGFAAIDSLQFSSSVTVPEPSTCALLGSGGLALLWAVRRR